MVNARLWLADKELNQTVRCQNRKCLTAASFQHSKKKPYQNPSKVSISRLPNSEVPKVMQSNHMYFLSISAKYMLVILVLFTILHIIFVFTTLNHLKPLKSLKYHHSHSHCTSKRFPCSSEVVYKCKWSEFVSNFVTHHCFFFFSPLVVRKK